MMRRGRARASGVGPGPWAALCAALLLPACHLERRPPGRDSLLGLSAPLAPMPTLALAVPGTVEGRLATVFFDSALAVSRVTAACFAEPLVSEGRVVLVDPLGAEEERPLTRLSSLTVSGERLAPFVAALVEGAECDVFLAGRQLDGVALEVDALARTVRFVPTRGRDAWRALSKTGLEELTVLELTVDPRHDWPLLAVRLAQGDAVLTAPFVFSTAAIESRVSDGAAQAAGLRRAKALLQGLPEAGVSAEALAGLDAYVVTDAALAPTVVLPPLRLLPVAGAPRRGVAGVLGFDAWPSGEVTVDLGAGVLAVRAPRRAFAEGAMRCGRGGPPTAEGCFELASERRPEGLEVRARVWAPAPEGAAVLLEFDGVSPAECRVGLSLPPGAAGRSTRHLLPWASLSKSLPACAVALAGATGVRYAAVQPGAAPCPQLGLFAAEPSRPRIVCQGGRSLTGASSLSDSRLLELLAAALKPAPAAPETEPGDPE